MDALTSSSSHGAGSYVFDVAGKRYLDLGAGIAVCCLGHAHPAIIEALTEQSQKLIHVSNLYFTEPQGRLAAELVKRIGPGKCFFANSGAEANEGLFKLARKFGHDEGRFEILTAMNSFHGRTMAGIAATGQDKVKKGFEPMMPGFRHIPFNDLEAARNAISPATVAIMIEGVQGEGGVTPATPEYLLGLRALCDEKKLLLFMDGVQCGHYRTGKFQSFQRILEETFPAAEEHFLPDGISMAKSLGGGFPIGAFWVRAPYRRSAGAGHTRLNVRRHAARLRRRAENSRSHRTRTAGRTCAQTRRMVEKGIGTACENLPERGQTGARARFHAGNGTGRKREIPGVRRRATRPPPLQFVNRLHEAGVLTIPAGTQVIRLLPPLNLKPQEAGEGIAKSRKSSNRWRDSA